MNVVQASLTLIVWVAIVLLANWIYKKQNEKIKLWKIALLTLAGLFSFSFTLPKDGEMLRIAILPLGVMFLFFFFRKKKEKWNIYRKYAWLGFWANYLFLAAILLSQPIYQQIYIENQASTYLASFHDPTLTAIHPSGVEKSIDGEVLESFVSSMSQQSFPSLDWYYETKPYDQQAPVHVKEKFPYILTGVQAKWGSGIHSVIYVERDGKGLLVSTPKGQHYFRSEMGVFGEGEE